MATKKVRQDEWIKAIRPDPKETSDSLVVVEGYIGESSLAGHIRIYINESLNDFIEVPENDVVHHVEMKDSPMGGSKLWVNADAMYTYGDPKEKKRPKASFLQGDLAGEPHGPATYQCPHTAINSGCMITNMCTAHNPCATNQFVRCPKNIQAEQLANAQNAGNYGGYTNNYNCHYTNNYNCHNTYNYCTQVTCAHFHCTTICPQDKLANAPVGGVHSHAGICQTHNLGCQSVGCTQVVKCPTGRHGTCPPICPVASVNTGCGQIFNQFGNQTGYEGFDPYQGM